MDFSNLPFGQANVYRLGLSFSQVLYAGGRIKAQEAQATLRRDSAVLNLDSAQAQNTLDVAEAYYDAALTDWLVSIAEETYAQADRSLTVTRSSARPAGCPSSNCCAPASREIRCSRASSARATTGRSLTCG